LEHPVSSRDIVIGHIKALSDELSRIPDTPLHAEKRESRQRGIELYTASLRRIDAGHLRFLEYQAELVARCGLFSHMSRGN
jgi:hypothetical protein